MIDSSHKSCFPKAITGALKINDNQRYPEEKICPLSDFKTHLFQMIYPNYE